MSYFIFFLLLLATTAAAETSATPDTTHYQLPATEVTATRAVRSNYDLPVATSVITNTHRARPGLSLDESLRPVPGLFVSNRHNLSQGDRLSLRGLGARAAFGVRGIKILLDGIPLTLADGQSQLNNLDLGSTSRIEILRGPSSALYGNAGGGVLSAHTQAPAESTWRIEPRLVWGSYGLLRLQTRLSGQTDKTHYFASLYDLQSEGYREHADARARGLNARIGHTLTRELDLTLLLHLHDAPYLFNPSSLDHDTAEQRPHSARGFIVGQGASKKVRQSQAGLRLKYRPAADRTSTLVFYGVDRDLKNPIPGRIIELDRRAFGLRSENEFAWRDLRLVTGIDLDLQDDGRREFANEGLPDGVTVNDEQVFSAVQYGANQVNQQEKVRSIGPFLSLEKDLGPALTLTFAGRYDRYHFEVEDRFTATASASGTREMDQFSPMVGLVWRLSPLARIYGHIATAFQTPTTSELGNRPNGAGGFNPDLEPERILSFETGFRRHVPQLRLDVNLALYQLEVTDALIPFQVEDPASEEIYFRNAGQTRNRGLELALRSDLRSDLRLTLAYTFGDYVFEDYEVETNDGRLQLADNEVPGVPRHRLFTALAYQGPRGFFADLELERVGRYWANDFNGPPPQNDTPAVAFQNDAYLRTDLRLGLHHRASEVFLGVENLFAADYSGSIVPNAFGGRFFEPAPGRTLRLGLSGRFGD